MSDAGTLDQILFSKLMQMYSELIVQADFVMCWVITKSVVTQLLA